MLKGKWFGSIPSGVVVALTMSLLLVLALSLAACSGPTSAVTPAVTDAPAQTAAPTNSSKPSGPVDAKWIDAHVNGDTVSIPESEIENDWNTRFEVPAGDSSVSAMA